ncbi:Dr1-associated corepressor [Portunus trituberculatus]|uniref:Dr1-associated corepressor n=1 Tax=Portunus trituberculatus TaxID=210409 RepID=A0A5B7GNJ6_PORTR|nr:Dr1-associated corepressor [Portunus trituberculatus]
MPGKKKKYNARFPPVGVRGFLGGGRYTGGGEESCQAPWFSRARIKKIMQTDEEVGKVAAAVPVIIYILLCNIIRR